MGHFDASAGLRCESAHSLGVLSSELMGFVVLLLVGWMGLVLTGVKQIWPWVVFSSLLNGERHPYLLGRCPKEQVGVSTTARGILGQCLSDHTAD